MSQTMTGSTVGIVGLGVMGSALAKSLLDEGAEVYGFDVVEERCGLLAELGGVAVGSPAEVVSAAPVTILSLPSSQALRAVVAGPDGLLSADDASGVCIETSTLPIDVKRWAQAQLDDRNIVLLDCPISGTGGQARNRDIVFYASGPADTVEDVRHVLLAMGRGAPFVGDFGMGTTMKLVSNLLVAVHTMAAAEALTLAAGAGVDPELALELLASGAGTSRMLEVRGPMMVEQSYPGDSATISILHKDVELILDFATRNDVPTPLLAAAAPFFVAARAQGRGGQDPAVLAEVLRTLGHPVSGSSND